MALYFFDIEKHPIIKTNPDTFIATLDGKQCITKQLLLTEIAHLFHFPEYFGNNFDALEECLESLDMIDSSEIYWLITNHTFICCDEKESDHLETFYLVIQSALEFHFSSKKNLSIIANKSFLTKIKPTNFD